MSDMMISNPRPALLPLPAAAVTVRAGTVADLPFMDKLQKMHAKAVGFMPLPQLEGHVLAGKVLVAEDCPLSVVRGPLSENLTTDNGPRTTDNRVGYLIAADRYFKRDDVGIIYQMNVLPQRQRGYVAAAMLKAQFERSAYGCRLYCCWCAQDLAANRFWEAMGFVPLAFRTGGTGSGKKPGGARMHIFWQKRIREGDEETPWWFPSETAGGAIKENRIVLPIPPGTHWSDAKPMVLPGGGNAECTVRDAECRGLPGKKARAVKNKPVLVVVEPKAIAAGGLRFGAVVPSVIEEKAEPKQKKPKAKNDPRLVAAARELKDRWLEELAAGRYLPGGSAKYAVGRLIAGRVEVAALELPAVQGGMAARTAA